MKRSGLCIAAFVCLAAGISFAQAQDEKSVTLEAELVVDADVSGAKIERNVFGQFAEFVGNVFTNGLYVGKDSTIPNTDGFRNDILDALREIKTPVVRWPGGCYADIYHWRDGIGPIEKRPKRLNGIWGGVVENNEVGTHEFFRFLELIGADAYINGNLGTGSPQEMADWIEYVTGDRDTTIVQERKANGREDPWKISIFAIGNETWACGGNMTPERSADLHRQYATFIQTPPYPTFLDKKPDDRMKVIASGGNVDDYNFTSVLMEKAAAQMDVLSLHYYTVPRRKILDFGSSTGFPETEWASTLKHALWLDELLTKHSKRMDKFDPEKRVGLYVDEWGTWYDPEQNAPGLLWQQNTIRDAMVAALHFNIFFRHAERVRMTSISQVANVLQAPILTDKEKMLLTPTYYVYKMYVPFQDATFVPSKTSAPKYENDKISMPTIDASAARGADGKLYLSLVNLDPHSPVNLKVILNNSQAKSANGQILAADAIDSHNTFENPNSIVPSPFAGLVVGSSIVFNLPSKSVAVVGIQE